MKRVLKGFLQTVFGVGVIAAMIYGYIRIQLPPSDEKIERLLVGQWTEEHWTRDGKDEQGGTATTTYKPDGTFEATATRGKKGAAGTKYVVSGTWQVKNGVILETIEKCEPPFLPKGQVSKDRVRSIDHYRLTYADADNIDLEPAVYEMKRVSE